MNEEQKPQTNGQWKNKCSSHSNASNAVYGLGLVGAAIYYIQHAETLWLGVIGVLKAIVWPAFLVYKALEYMGM